MKKIRIILIILICLLLLPLNVFAISYAKVGADGDFNGDINIPSGCKYYINGTALAVGDITGAAATAGKLSQFAATTSAELASVISDETGTDKLVYNTSPVLVTPTLGAASATSINLTGGQIAFPAAAAPSANANTLDDYEEETWTAVIRGSGTAGTYEIASQLSNYTKIGRVVYLNCLITLATSVTGGGTGYMQITGCPFTNMANSDPVGSVNMTGIDFTGTQINVVFVGNSAIIYLRETVDAGGWIDFPVSAIGANDAIGFSITFFI